MREEIFVAARIHIHKLANQEKKRLEPEKGFQKILSKWNQKEDKMQSPNLGSGC